MYFKKLAGSKVVLPCTNKSLLPAIAAKLAGYKVVIQLATHHEISHVTNLLFSLTNEIIPCSVSLANVLKARKIANRKLTGVCDSTQCESQLGLVLSHANNRNVLALSDEDDVKGLFEIFRICAIVYRVVPEMKLGIITYRESGKKLVNKWQKQYGTPGMCFFIEKKVNTIDNEYGFQVAISGPGIVDFPVLLELASKANINIIADKSSANDFPDSSGCDWIDGVRIRQYASALLKVLK